MTDKEIEFIDDESINEEVEKEIENEEQESNSESDKISKSHAKMKCTEEQYLKYLADNQNFPYCIVNREFSKYPYDIKQDLYSAANMGMMYAATKYDPAMESKCKFISYAVHWIRYYINEEIRKIYPVKFNQNYVCKRKKVNTFIEKYKKEHNNIEPDIKTISENVKMSEKVVKNILKINHGQNFTFLSFNTPTQDTDKNGEGSEAVNTDKLVKEYLDKSETHDMMLQFEIRDIFALLKKNVPELDYKIFYDYHILGETYSELAKKYHLKFPASAAYLIKKCESKCKQLIKE